jgi:hypothetical protein
MTNADPTRFDDEQMMCGGLPMLAPLSDAWVTSYVVSSGAVTVGHRRFVAHHLRRGEGCNPRREVFARLPCRVTRNP